MHTPLIPAATLVLVRDSHPGIETLLLQRHSQASFLAGHWVFPGGMIEAQDQAGNTINAARHAAIRETVEECGIQVHANDCLYLSRWIAPDIAPKRFDTHFFVAASASGTLALQASEIRDAAWLAPATAIERHYRQQLPMLPPTLVTLLLLAEFNDCNSLLQYLQDRPADCFAPKAGFWQDQLVMLYAGDSGYASGDASVNERLHRCINTSEGWRYYRQ